MKIIFSVESMILAGLWIRVLAHKMMRHGSGTYTLLNFTTKKSYGYRNCLEI
jgi:hypothetical protein